MTAEKCYKVRGQKTMTNSKVEIYLLGKKVQTHIIHTLAKAKARHFGRKRWWVALRLQQRTQELSGADTTISGK